MDTQRTTNEPSQDTVYSRVEDLRLDQVVASHPEIGPTPPDGGYGWMIVIGGVLYNLSVTTVLTAYGIFNLYADHDDEYDDSTFKIWDQKLMLVPVFCVIMRLLLESWCREMVKVFNMPRFMALAGICTTVAGILLSSFGTDQEDSYQLTVNIFAGIFTGTGIALTSQQTEVLVKHYFRDKLEVVQTILKLAVALGACLVPIVTSFLCDRLYLDRAILVFGALLMQNSLFLAAYSRPIYIVRMLRRTYKMIRDIEDDDDQEIFSRNSQTQEQQTEIGEAPSRTVDQLDDERVIASFHPASATREIIAPAVQMRDVVPATLSENRFSSDFSTMVQNDPEPLYRETTVVNDMTSSGFHFAFDPNVREGTERRNASVQRNFISIMSMFADSQFYLYTLLHLTTTYSLLILALFLPTFISQQMNTFGTWRSITAIAITNGVAFCFVMLCSALPKSLNKKARLCSSFCIVGAFGFYGIALSATRPFLILWGILATFAASSSDILKQPIYDDMMNEFDATATSTAANSITAFFILVWSLTCDYEVKTCFELAAFMQVIAASIFLVSTLKIHFPRRY